MNILALAMCLGGGPVESVESSSSPSRLLRGAGTMAGAGPAACLTAERLPEQILGHGPGRPLLVRVHT